MYEEYKEDQMRQLLDRKKWTEFDQIFTFDLHF